MEGRVCPILADERPEEEIWQKNLRFLLQVGAAGRQAVPGKEINETIAHTYNSSWQLPKSSGK